jgi:hypothetical protein
MTSSQYPMDSSEALLATFWPAVGLVMTTPWGETSLLLTYERFVNLVIGFSGSKYDTMLLSWKEKINYDLI